MKNSLLTLGVFLCFNVDAMQTDKDQETIPAILFTVNADPPVQIIQVPSQKKVKFEDQVGRRIKITGKNYNNVSVCPSTYINYATPADVVTNSLCKFFDVNTVECRRCSMSLDTYQELFPTIPSVTKKWSIVFWEKVISSISFFDN